MIVVGNRPTQDHFSKVSIYNFSGLKKYKKRVYRNDRKNLPWDFWEVSWVYLFPTTYGSFRQEITMGKFEATAVKADLGIFTHILIYWDIIRHFQNLDVFSYILNITEPCYIYSKPCHIQSPLKYLRWSVLENG